MFKKRATNPHNCSRTKTHNSLSQKRIFRWSRADRSSAWKHSGGVLKFKPDRSCARTQIIIKAHKQT